MVDRGAGLAADAARALRLGRRAVAVDRLIDAEHVIRAAPVPDWSTRRLLADCYRALRMYELAVPHLERGPSTERHRLAEVLLIWAEELEQVVPAGSDGAAPEHPSENHTDGHPGDNDPGEAMSELRRRARTELLTADELPENRSLITALTHDCDVALDPSLVDSVPAEDRHLPPVARARGQVARSRALLRLGRPADALERGRRAVELSREVPDDPVLARSAWHAVHRAELALGLDGARVADRLIQSMARSLWRERSHAMEAARLRRDAAVLDRRRVAAERLASIDPLTSLANRGALDAWLAHRPRGPMSLVMVDLTAFRSVNDRFSHLVGDQLLVRVARCLEAAVPDQMVFRFGGDEFVVATDRVVRPAGAAARIIRQAVAALDVDDLVGGPSPGCAVGWARSGPGEETAGLLAEADRLLLAAKRRRR
jgi:diguanylate cyclase (GGDEF)-like protein